MILPRYFCVVFESQHIHLLVDCRPQVLAYIEGQKENESSRKQKYRSAVSYLVQVYMGGMLHAIADYYYETKTTG